MKPILLFFLILFNFSVSAQENIPLNDWQFSRAGTDQWYPATVPGTVYTDLLKNKLIPDPFFADNESKLQWIDTCDWIYRASFQYDTLKYAGYNPVFDIQGLDTYADVFLNDSLLFHSENMFVGYRVDLPGIFRNGRNEIRIYFHSALKKTDSLAKAALPLVLPDNNRVYARKAQFQFGWDWGPKFIGCGIWKPFSVITYSPDFADTARPMSDPVARLVQKKDANGRSFYFEKRGKPVYIKGANWIPANIFLPSVTKNDYRRLLIHAKEANINMLRVWGGGVYEDDYFYTLCDSLGIMVWQDLMFAGGMYPADKNFMQSVKEEITYQVIRIGVRHPCVVLWCGNNEINEAWHNWGWQDQFKLHGADSAKVWKNYTTLFEDSIRAWIKDLDPGRSYIPSSPKYGWGHDKSFHEGDSHYWGLWWGLEPWEAFKTKTGRFVSEYGMQSMPNNETLKTYVPANDFNYSSQAVQSHQKANEGFKKLNFYLDKYFLDSAKLKNLSLGEYSYLTQCLQYYILKNSIAVHRSQSPRNMGTMLWQLNDCWPVTSWSIIDFSGEPKAAWYAVHKAYAENNPNKTDTVYPKNLRLKRTKITLKQGIDGRFSVIAGEDLKYVYIRYKKGSREFSDNYFDLKKGKAKIISLAGGAPFYGEMSEIEIMTLNDIYNK